eukprot:scaffold69671_cov60-Phaeocystis_antarctica.AAC.1
MLISVQSRLVAIDFSFAPSLPKHRQESAREAISRRHTVRFAGTMASPPDAVPDEAQAALSGMMEQLAAISAAPTEAEREQQYDVLAGMLAAATACTTPGGPAYEACSATACTPPPSMLAADTEAAATASSGSSSSGPASSLAAATTQAGPAASEDASTGTTKPTRTAKSSYVAQQKIEAVRGAHASQLAQPAALCGPRCNPMSLGCNPM